MQRHTRAHIRHQRKRHANRRIKLARQLFQTRYYCWWVPYRQEFRIWPDPSEAPWPLNKPYNVFANNEAYGRAWVDMEKQWYQDYGPDRHLSDRDAIKEQLDDMM